MESTFRPDDAARLWHGLQASWWIAGGWAIDLWLGRQTREHLDLDIAILRKDQWRVRRHLDGWDLHIAEEETLSPLPRDEQLDPPRHALWCRQDAEAGWAFELLINESSGTDWVFRRDDRVRRRLSGIGHVTPEGLPVLSPEIVLLFKAKNRREHDEADFANVHPTLDAGQRRWLSAALRVAHPGHDWIGQLSGTH